MQLLNNYLINSCYIWISSHLFLGPFNSLLKGVDMCSLLKALSNLYEFVVLHVLEGCLIDNHTTSRFLYKYSELIIYNIISEDLRFELPMGLSLLWTNKCVWKIIFCSEQSQKHVYFNFVLWIVGNSVPYNNL